MPQPRTLLRMDLSDALPRLADGCGPIGLLSSDEVMSVAEPFDQMMLAASRGPQIGVIVAAQGHGGAEQAGRMAMKYYRKLGAEPFLIPVLEREEAETYQLPDCDIVFMTGGSPRRLLRCLQQTPLWEVILERWRSGMTIAGSSAGAMALCEHCLVPNPGDTAPSRWTAGLGPVAGIGVAVHASSRSETWMNSIRSDASWPVVALDDATGVLLRHDAEPEVAGPGTVWVLP